MTGPAPKTDNERFWTKVNKDGRQTEYVDTACWEWTASQVGEGYGQFYSYRGVSDYIRVSAHRFSYIVHYGSIPDDLQVNHRCHNRLCVRPDHLYVGTQKDNIADMDLSGRSNRHVFVPRKGDKHHAAKLTKEDVEEIRDLAKSGFLSQRAIGDRFGVSQSRISEIKNGRSWNE